jgi:hypothetical protein
VVSQTIDDALAVADAVLYEGYLLYPYRHSSGKNRVRWQFGVLVPRDWALAHGLGAGGISGAAESWWQQTECLVEAGTRVELRLRFLHVQHRRVEGHLTPGEAADFDEAVATEVDLTMDLAGGAPAELRHEVRVPAAAMVVPGADGSRTVRRRAALSATVVAEVAPATAPFPLRRLRVRVENTATDLAADAPRRECLRHSLVATHLILKVHNGRFRSLLDPPAWAAGAAKDCRNGYTFPVLAGRPGSDDLVLSAPIILSDHPQIAPESPADLHDAAEIDEILTLRVLTLSEAEREEVRRTDPRAAAILARAEATTPEALARLHGTIRRPSTSEAQRPESQEPPGLGPGRRVRLRPRTRGTDAHDMFLAGRTARVAEVLHDVDGTIFYAVTVDDDPGAELHEWYGRTRHFRPDEVELLDLELEPLPQATS